MAAVQSLQQTAQAAANESYSADMRTAIDVMVTQLESMESTIKGHHQETQEMLNKRFSTLEAAVALALETKAAADPADAEWVDCVFLERAAFVAVEGAKARLDAAVTDMTPKCGQSSRDSQFSLTLAATSLTCDQAVHNSTDQLLNWEKRVRNNVTMIQNGILQSNRIYKASKKICDAALAVVANRTQDHVDEVDVWTKQRMQCRELNAERQKDLCAFGMRLQEKCKAEVEYEDLLDKTMGTNTIYSESDLRVEWDVVQTVSCMLEALKDSGKVAAPQECQRKHEPFETAVGMLVTHGEELHRFAHMRELWCNSRQRGKCGPLGFVTADTDHFLGYGSAVSSVELEAGYLSGGWMEEHLRDASLFRMSGESPEDDASTAHWLACIVEDSYLKVTELEVLANDGMVHMRAIDAHYQTHDGTATCTSDDVNARLESGEMEFGYLADSFWEEGFGVVGVRYSVEGSTSTDTYLPRDDCSGTEGMLMGNGSDARLLQLVSGNVTMGHWGGETRRPATLHRVTVGFTASEQQERWVAVDYDDQDDLVKMVVMQVTAVQGKLYLGAISAHRAWIKFHSNYLNKHGATVTAERANDLVDSGAMYDLPLTEAAHLYGTGVENLVYSLADGEKKTMSDFVAVSCSVGGGRNLGSGQDARNVEIKEAFLGGAEVNQGGDTVLGQVFKRTGENTSSTAAQRWLIGYVDYSGWKPALKMVEVEIRVLDETLYATVVGSHEQEPFTNSPLTADKANAVLDSGDMTRVSTATWKDQTGIGVTLLRAALTGRKDRPDVTFSNRGWSMPPRDGTAQTIVSTQYVEHPRPYAEPLTLKSGAPPFAFCEANSPL